MELIKEMRQETGLTQSAFAKRYHIPLQTLKQWESDANSSSFRTPPAYITYMLGRLVYHDYGIIPKSKAAKVHDLIRAAKDSRYHAAQWLRYLRKEFKGTTPKITPLQLDYLLESDNLTMFQKVSLSRAMQQDTITNQYVTALNRRATPSMLDQIRQKRGLQ